MINRKGENKRFIRAFLMEKWLLCQRRICIMKYVCLNKHELLLYVHYVSTGNTRWTKAMPGNIKTTERSIPVSSFWPPVLHLLRPCSALSTHFYGRAKYNRLLGCGWNSHRSERSEQRIGGHLSIPCGRCRHRMCQKDEMGVPSWQKQNTTDFVAWTVLSAVYEMCPF